MDIDYAGIGSNYKFLFFGLLSLVVSVNTYISYYHIRKTIKSMSNAGLHKHNSGWYILQSIFRLGWQKYSQNSTMIWLNVTRLFSLSRKTK